MKLQRYEIRALDDWGGRIHWQPNRDGGWCSAAHVAHLESENAALQAECDRLRAENECLKQPQQPMSADEVTEPGIFKGLADSIWIMGAQFGWECCEANDKDRFNHAINTQDFPIAVQVPLKAPEV